MSKYPDYSKDYRKIGTNERQVVDEYFGYNKHKEVYTFPDANSNYHSHWHIDRYGKVTEAHGVEDHPWSEVSNIPRDIRYVSDFDYHYYMLLELLSILSVDQLKELKEYILELNDNKKLIK